MLPPRQQSRKPSRLRIGRANLDGDGSPGSPSPAAQKRADKPSTLRSARSNGSEHTDDGETGYQRSAADLKATGRSAPALPRSWIEAPPETQWGFDERKNALATKDNDSLKRNIRWQWHTTAQRVVSYAGPSGIALVGFVLTRELGLPPEAAVKLSLACLASAAAGHFSREWLPTLSGRRRSRHHRNDDDAPVKGEDRSS